MKIDNFFSELKRRNVYKIAVAYAVVSWLLIQIATQVFPFFEIPNWAVRLVVLVLIAGFPVALVFSWAFEITPEGIKRESEVAADKSITHHTGRKIVALTIALAAIAAGLLAFQLLRSRSPRPAVVSATTAGEISSKSIAVLPFDNLSDATFKNRSVESYLPELNPKIQKRAGQFAGGRKTTRRGQSAGRQRAENRKRCAHQCAAHSRRDR